MVERARRRREVEKEQAEQRRRQRYAAYAQRGGPAKYNPEMMPIVAKFMCQRGATMCELAQTFQVNEATLYQWINKHQELHDAIQVGVDVFNPRVERSLAELALGFWVTTREAVYDKEGNLLTPEQRQYYPPNVTACIFFLKNRLREKWRDVHRVENEVRLLKTSEELQIEIRKDILELQRQGYDPKLIEDKRGE